MALTPKQQAFCREYLVDLNATQAAIRAGYVARTARQQGTRLLSYAAIQERIQKGKEKRAEKVGLTAEEVLRQLAEQAGANIADAFDAQGRVRSIHELPPGLQRSIKEVEMGSEPGEDGNPVTFVRKIKFYDKQKALELTGKHLGMFVERHEHTHKGEIAHRLTEARNRTRGTG